MDHKKNAVDFLGVTVSPTDHVSGSASTPSFTVGHLGTYRRLYQEVRGLGYGISVLSYPLGEEEFSLIAKRRHDLKAALRTLDHTLQQLDEGYRFDDEYAAEKTASIRRAVGVISRDAGVLIQLLSNDE